MTIGRLDSKVALLKGAGCKNVYNPASFNRDGEYSNCLDHKIRYYHSLSLSSAKNDGANLGNHPYTEQERHSTVP